MSLNPNTINQSINLDHWAHSGIFENIYERYWWRLTCWNQLVWPRKLYISAIGNCCFPLKAGSRIFQLCPFTFLFWRYYIYCPFDIFRKDVSCLAFSLKWKYFVLIDHILSETICLFYFCVLFSNMYPKIKFIAKNWSDLCNFYSTMILFEFLSKKIFFNFLCWI